MWLALALVGCAGDGNDTVPTGDPGVTVTAPEDPRVEDTFIQEINDPVDVLWVVDGHWTNGVTQVSTVLAEAMDVLLIADPDWRMGVLSADVSNAESRGKIQGVFETWPPPNGILNVASSLAPARVRDAVYSALTENLERNGDFVRADANLYILAMSDMVDSSGDEIIAPTDWATWFQTVDVTSSTRMGVLTTPSSAPSWSVVTSTTGGQVFQPSTDAEFRTAVRNLLYDALGQQREFLLTREPADPPSFIEVVIREHATYFFLNIDFTYDDLRNSVEFVEYVPPPGAEIRIPYNRSVDGSEPPQAQELTDDDTPEDPKDKDTGTAP